MIFVKSARGNEEVFLRLGGIRKLTRRAVRQTWFRTGKDLKSEVEREIRRKPKSGRTYLVRGRGGRTRRHVASAPGETHADLSGDLRRSVSWKVRGTDRLDFGYGVAVTTRNAAPPYAEIEFGFGRVAARPSLENAINATQRNVERHFLDQMNKAFRR